MTDLDTLVDYFESARRRTTALLANAPWPVFHLDAERTVDQEGTPATTPEAANEAISSGE